MSGTRFSPVRVNPVLIHSDEKRMSLDGKWNFCLDPEDKGKKFLQTTSGKGVTEG